LTVDLCLTTQVHWRLAGHLHWKPHGDGWSPRRCCTAAYPCLSSCSAVRSTRSSTCPRATSTITEPWTADKHVIEVHIDLQWAYQLRAPQVEEPGAFFFCLTLCRVVRGLCGHTLLHTVMSSLCKLLHATRPQGQDTQSATHKLKNNSKKKKFLLSKNPLVWSMPLRTRSLESDNVA
jgi:hypothetical protein